MAAGAAGSVYRGLMADGTEVVVKLNRMGVEEPKIINGVTMIVCNKEREVEALRRLTEVDSVARFFGTVQLHQLVFKNGLAVDSTKFESPGLVLEYIAGPTVRSYFLKEAFWRRLLTTEEAAIRELNALMLQGLLSVTEMSDRGVFHLDWHFRNILVDESSVVKFDDNLYPRIKTIDFGIVKLDVSIDHSVQYFARKLHRIDLFIDDLCLVPKKLADQSSKAAFPADLVQHLVAAGSKASRLRQLVPETTRFLEYMAEEYARLIDSPLARRKLIGILCEDAFKNVQAELDSFSHASWTNTFLAAVKRAFIPKNPFPTGPSYAAVVAGL